MKLVLIPILFPLAYVAFVNHNKIMDEYRAAYPADPAKRAAIEHCAQSRGFNRLDPDEREACYAAAGLWPEVAIEAPRAAPYYPYSPSQLPASDARREEANDTYCSATQAALLAAAVLPARCRKEAPPVRAR